MKTRIRLGVAIVVLAAMASACSGHEAAKTISDPGDNTRTHVSQLNQQTQDLEQQTGG